MLGKSTSDSEVYAKASEAIAETMTEMANVLAGINPEDLIVTDEAAMDTMKEILEGIPENCRGLYPEDDMLAAIAFAPIYYRLKY